MTDEQINEAIEQVKSFCDDLMETYTSVSMRQALRAIGYTHDEANTVILHVAEGGFTYCLDPMIESTHFDPNNPNAVNDMVTDRPSVDACYWGPDQLKSRLNSLMYWGRR